MPRVNLIARIDMSGLNRGLDAARRYSRRTVAQLVNTAAYWIAINAKAGMPYVTPDKVDKELGVIQVPVIGKRGKVLKRKKAFAPKPVEGVPFAALLVSARANPQSRYNQKTNQRYAIDKNPFKGVTRAAGRAAMRAMIDKMVKSRHRAGKFLLAGWIPAIRKLFPYTANKFLRGAASPLEGKNAYYGADLGNARVAQSGGYEAIASIENDIGLEGKQAGSMNRALNTIGGPILQAAVDREGRRQMDYALKKAGQELQAETDRHWL